VSKTGVLLMNLGTPERPTTGAVRSYLRQFLSDPRVIDIHPVGRWLLLNLIILPFRPRKSAAAYRSIWGKEGSPLLTFSQDLVSGVRAELGEGYAVELGMRYGEPSIANGLARLKAEHVGEIVLFPLFPQYSSAATGSALEEAHRVLSSWWNVPPVCSLRDFYDESGFIAAFEAVTRPVLDDFRPDHVLFSYHGLPERHVEKSDETGQHCLRRTDCCDSIVPSNVNCYRAQCYATTRALVKALGLDQGEYDTSFQSRLGRTPWIKPYTDEVLHELRRQGKKRLAVMCPAFVADCLETLEEIAIRGDEQWKELGGEALCLVPSLNAHPRWVQAVSDAVRQRGARGVNLNAVRPLGSATLEQVSISA
jgi:protoporphyrin/coproporphyrin ferrochelatase